ncbi:hypothetical protein [Nocardia sp. NPDC060259]|uniref:hypothetical protein n=1 Tax=Nocardia sp. NPDC060259 TaxID=3347088 RepID=UPI003656BAB8
MPTVFLGGPIVFWTPLESSPEPESPDGTPYWQSPESGYPGAIEQPTDPEPDPGTETPTEPDPATEPPSDEPDPAEPGSTGGE